MGIRNRDITDDGWSGGIPTARRSRSADESYSGRLAGIQAMTVEERVLLALSLPRKFASIIRKPSGRPLPKPEGILLAAEEVACRLRHHGFRSVVIGAAAMAAHCHPRYTESIDFGGLGSPESLSALGADLSLRGHRVELDSSSSGKPAILDITGEYGLIRFFRFEDSSVRILEDAVEDATALRPGSELRIAPLPQLIALKLTAPGRVASDPLELLKSNPEADLGAIARVCSDYGLGALDEILSEVS